MYEKDKVFKIDQVNPVVQVNPVYRPMGQDLRDKTFHEIN